MTHDLRPLVFTGRRPNWVVDVQGATHLWGAAYLEAMATFLQPADSRLPPMKLMHALRRCRPGVCSSLCHNILRVLRSVYSFTCQLSVVELAGIACDIMLPQAVVLLGCAVWWLAVGWGRKSWPIGSPKNIMRLLGLLQLRLGPCVSCWCRCNRC